MRVLVACDKFKGTFSSAEAGRESAGGARNADAIATVLAVADGGEGTADAIEEALGGTRRTAAVRDAFGRTVEAAYTLLGGGRTAVVDAAQAVGLWRVADGERDPWSASSGGVGDLVAAAAADGVEEVIVAVGGTATVDGGVGAIDVLRRVHRLPRLRVACDVRTAWDDAARVFGPQKGADAAQVEALTRRLADVAETLERDPRGVPATGCGGGLSGGLWAAFDAELVSGADLVLDLLDFDALLAGSMLVVTGEGCLDAQTTSGKLVSRIAARCERAAVPCVAVVGRDLLGPAAEDLPLARVLEAGTPRSLRAAGEELVAWRRRTVSSQPIPGPR